MRRLCQLVLALVLLSTARGMAAADNAVVDDIRVGRTPERTRVVLDLSREAEYHLFRLANPERVVIDLSHGEIADTTGDFSFAGTPVQRLRTGKRAGNVLRLVLDLTATGISVRDFALEPDPAAGRGHRIVVDLGTPASASPLIAGAPPPGDEFSPASSMARRREPAAGSGDRAADVPREADATSPASNDAPASEARRVSHSGIPAREQADTLAGQGADVGPKPGSAQKAARAVAEPRRRTPEPLAIEFSGTWEHEWAWAPDDSSSQKFESIVQPRWDVTIPGGVDITAILRLRGDGVGDLGPTARRPSNYAGASAPWFNSGEAEVSLRAFYADFRWGAANWRLGKQQVVWGQADGIKVLDVVNPQSFREFILDDFDDSRIPLWTANVNVPLGNAANLQLLWIPDTTYHELAEPGTPFAFSTPRIIPQVPITAIAEVEKPDDPLRDGDGGIALSAFAGGWDLSINYLYRYLDAPVLPVHVRGPARFRLEPEHRRSHLLGGTFSNVFGSVTLRGEFAWNSDTFQPTNTLIDDAVAGSAEFSSVIGLDWLLGMDALVSAQWFNSYLFDHQSVMGRDENEQLMTLLYQRDFYNASWRFRGITIHSLNDGDTQFQLKLSHWLASELQVWLGLDSFSGNQRGLFGQFADRDRVLVGFEYGF